jgi:hypothetical protein
MPFTHNAFKRGGTLRCHSPSKEEQFQPTVYFVIAILATITLFTIAIHNEPFDPSDRLISGLKVVLIGMCSIFGGIMWPLLILIAAALGGLWLISFSVC